ncbi:MAG: prepilin-type N-terminal cleavage/methylation domain-containing protein [bacterium]|nr:prepilin-type N-terminal cleavage/methylation domain-containing protein [bacterium]
MSGRRPSEGRCGFTLIELLVVISIIALLMAILMPTLQRARNQARSVVCQSHLKQWGVLMATYVSENDGRLPEPPSEKIPPARSWLVWGGWVWEWGWRAARDAESIARCPMATKLADPTGLGNPVGGTFLAWGRSWPGGQVSDHWDSYGSYGCNGAIVSYWEHGNLHTPEMKDCAWRTADVRGRDKIPVYFDCARPWNGGSAAEDYMAPPEYEATPTAVGFTVWNSSCINRHDGGGNMLFLDWSVRKVGLKELWTLKWHRKYETAGPWTKAGGVMPGDWPAWMRSFRDY